MKKYILILISCLLSQLQASHIIGGEISYQPDITTPTKYLFTVSVIYNAHNVTDSPNDLSKIDVSTLPIDYGDNTNATLFLDGGLQAAGNGVVRAIYKGTHIFPFETGTYIVSVVDSYRPDYILNIPNNKQHPIYFSTTVNLSLPDQGLQFLDFPHKVLSNTPYVYEPQIVNPDNDTLLFNLITPFTGPSQSIQNYKYPGDPTINQGKTDVVFSVDPKTGKITWNKPPCCAHYAIAVRINKIRKDKLLSTIIRDYTLITTDGLVGIDDQEDNTPTLLSTNLIGEGTTLSAHVSGDLTITDLSGKVVFQQRNYVQDSPLALALKSGMYVCTLTGLGVKHSERLVVE